MEGADHFLISRPFDLSAAQAAAQIDFAQPVVVVLVDDQVDVGVREVAANHDGSTEEFLLGRERVWCGQAATVEIVAEIVGVVPFV